MNAVDAPTRVAQLEAAIRRHQEGKAEAPECTCWIIPDRKLDLALYAELNRPGAPEERVQRLEAAIRANRAGKKDTPECTCFANAPQWVDAELYKVLNEG